MRRRPLGNSVPVAINRYINSAYDNVLLVAENIEAVNTAAENIEFLSSYLGAFEDGAVPTERPDGSPLETGDFYYSDKATYYYNADNDTWTEFNPEELLTASVAAVNAAVEAEESKDIAVDAAEKAFSLIGGVDIGDYEDDPMFNNIADYVVFGRGTSGIALFKVEENVDLPYTVDSTTNPHPTDDDNLRAYTSTATMYTYEETTYLTDGQVVVDATSELKNYVVYLWDSASGERERLDVVYDYTTNNSNQIVLTDTYPVGSIVTIVFEDIGQNSDTYLKKQEAEQKYGDHNKQANRGSENSHPASAIGTTSGESVQTMVEAIKGKNELSNSNFLIPSPDDITHPSSVSTSYNAGTQIFSGVYAGEDGCTVSYVNGRVTCTVGSYEYRVPNTNGLAYIPAFSSSVASYDGLPKQVGVTHTLDNDAYVVSITPEAGSVFNVKFEQGSLATRHETGSLSTSNLPDYTNLVFDSTLSMASQSLNSGVLVTTKAYHSGWAAQITPPRGSNKYTIVSSAQYASMRSQATSVLGFLDFPLANGNIALANTENLSLFHFGAVADYSKSGSLVTATDNTLAITSALTFCIETANSIDMSCCGDGGFYQEGDIDLTPVTPSVFADSIYIKADAEIETDLTWIFKDGNGVGVNLPSRLGVSMKRVTIATDANDGRLSLFNRIGISSTTADASFRFVHKYVNVTNFSGAGFEYHDVSTSYAVGGRCTKNAIAYDFGLTFWTSLANTTINWRGTYFITNDIGIRGNKVSESLFQGVVFENNRRGFQNASGIKNTFIGCYGENNDQNAYLDLSGASAAFINCFSSGAGDTWLCTGDAASYGFDRIGSAFYDDRFTKTQKVNFYDREGGEAEGFSAQNAEGEIQFLQSNGTKLGKVGASYAQRVGGSSLRGSYSFLISDGVVVGEKPDSWTISKTTDGDYRIDFDSAIRPPLLTVMAAPVSQNGIPAGQVNMDIYTRVIGTSDWFNFSVADGIQLLTSVSGALTASKIWVKCDEELQ